MDIENSNYYEEQHYLQSLTIIIIGVTVARAAAINVAIAVIRMTTALV